MQRPSAPEDNADTPCVGAERAGDDAVRRVLPGRDVVAHVAVVAVAAVPVAVAVGLFFPHGRVPLF